jgi:hypothetical protein
LVEEAWALRWSSPASRMIFRLKPFVVVMSMLARRQFVWYQAYAAVGKVVLLAAINSWDRLF